MSRLEGNDINNRTNDPEDMMLEIMQILRGTVTPVPDVGNFYTFVYNPKHQILHMINTLLLHALIYLAGGFED